MDLPVVRHRLQVDCLGMGIGLNESRAFSMGSAVINLAHKFDDHRAIPSLRTNDRIFLPTYQFDLSIDVPISSEQRKIRSVRILGEIFVSFGCKKRRDRQFRVYDPISFDRSVFLLNL